MGSADWQIVGYSDDPIPDDPAVVANQISHLRSVAATIATQVAALPQSGHLDALVWKSQDNDAPSKFRQQASQLPHDLDLLRTRYVKVADALDGFHPVLVSTQGTARTQLPIAVTAYQDMQAAQAGVTQQQDFQYQAKQAAANQNANLPAGKTPVQPTQWTGPDYPSMLTDATTRYNTAKGKIHGAVNTFNGASQTAAGKVNAASADSLKNQSPGFWSRVENVVEQVTAPLTLLRYIPGIQSAEHYFMDVAEVAGDLSAVFGLLALLPIPGFDVVMDALSEGASAVEALSDVIVIDTDDNAHDRKSATEDLGGAVLSLVTGGVARDLSKGPELLKGVKAADEALEGAKTVKVAKAAEAFKAVDKYDSALDEVTSLLKDHNAVDGFEDIYPKLSALDKIGADVDTANAALSDAHTAVVSADTALTAAQKAANKTKLFFALDVAGNPAKAIKDAKAAGYALPWHVGGLYTAATAIGAANNIRGLAMDPNVRKAVVKGVEKETHWPTTSPAAPMQ